MKILLKRIAISWLYLAAGAYCFPNDPTYSFKSLTLADGLSSSVVTTIAQDRRGVMWFGTYDGLNKFDGYEFTVYKNEIDNPYSISGNAVFDIYEDRKGHLLIGTKRGLDLYDASTDRFVHFRLPGNIYANISDIVEIATGEILIAASGHIYKVNLADTTCSECLSDTLIENNITLDAMSRILYDSQGVYWISHRSETGIVTFHPETGEINQYQVIEDKTRGMLSNIIHDIIEDDAGNIWIASSEGLSIYDRKTDQFKHFQHNPNDPTSLSGNVCWDIFQDSKGNIWIGTTQDGLNLFDKSKQNFRHFRNDKFDETSLTNNSVQAIYEDHNGILWIGTAKGVNLSRLISPQFHTYRNIPGEKNSLSHNFVVCFAEDRKGNIWIGTDGGGLNYFDRNNNKFIQYKSMLRKQIPASVLSLCVDRKGKLWVGSYASGIQMFDPEHNQYDHFYHDPNHPNGLGHNDIRCIFEDSHGNIWFATNGGGVNKLIDKERKVFKKIVFDPNNLTAGLANNYCLTIEEDSYGMLWFGTYHGLTMYDPVNEHCKSFYSYEETGLSDYWIYSIHEDRNENLWVGTSQGLNLLNRDNWTFTKFGDDQGFSRDIINGIMDDNRDYLWLSTNKGLIKFNPETRLVKKYSVQDGLQSDEFNHGSCYKLSSGEFLFGGVNGFTMFHPDRIVDVVEQPKVAITGLIFLNQKVLANTKDSPFKTHITETKEITLTHKQAKQFSFEYNAFEYLFPQKIQYRYKLDNYHDDWIYTGNNRIATFTNLNTGNYIFRVTTTNSLGLWQEEGAYIKLTILPPFWLTWQAYVIYLGLLILIIVLYHHFSMKFLKLKTDLQLQQIENEKVHELENLKSQFFTNISHEFRTPITLIMLPLKELISNGKKMSWSVMKEQFTIMCRSSERLLRLVNQVLNFNKIEAGRLNLDKKDCDIIGFLQNIVESFAPMAAEKHIVLSLDSQLKTCYMSFDPIKLDMVIFNLLSNAFKYTPDNGKIAVRVSYQNNNTIEIRVTDTGIGIPGNHLDHIFERFYQVSNLPSDTNPGAGIGLALSKEIVKLHNGEISVESTVGSGTCFTVHLPIEESTVYKDHSIEIISEVKNTDEETIDDFSDENDEEQRLRVLIVEDDHDLRHYLHNELKSAYRIVEASNGKQGLQKAIELMPDLIISDIMMCEMDGIELCGKLKTTELTSHIPVILLTARDSEAYQLEGLETGADDYIFKPFNLQTFKAKINNTLETRRKLRERFSREIHIKPKDIVINSVDEQFLNRAIEIVESNISNSDFNVDAFSKSIGLSRVQLFRKIKGLTSETPVEFIQTIRLQRAAQLLEQSKLNVTQICYETGFNYPSHFAKLFKMKFGMLPKEYQKQNPDPSQPDFSVDHTSKT